MFDYDLTAIPNHQTACYTPGGDLRPATDAIVMAAHTIGVPRLTRGSAPLFYARLALAEQLGGQMLGGRPITPQDIQAHLGLVLTASRELTTSEWLTELEEHIVGPRLVELARSYWAQTGETPIFLAELELDPELDESYAGPERRQSEVAPYTGPERRRRESV